MNKRTLLGCSLLVLLAVFLTGYWLAEQQKQIAAQQEERDNQMMQMLADAMCRANTSVVTVPQQTEKLPEVGFRPHIEAQKNRKDA